MTLTVRILDDLDQRVEGTYDKLKRGSKRLQRFILANEGDQVLCHTLSDLCRVQVQLLHHCSHRHFVHTTFHGYHDIIE